MNVEICSSAAQWNNWLSQVSPITPLCAHADWGELLVREGSAVEYLFVRENDATVAGCMVVTVQTRFVRYAYSPRGPLCVSGVDVGRIYDELEKLLKKRGFVFWRIEPENLPDPLPRLFYKTPNVQPATTLVLDFTKTPEELLVAMHQKTRYNIRLAQKKNLEVCYDKNPDLFWSLSTATSERDGFRLHPRRHYEEVIGSNFADQITVYAEGKPVASAVCTLVGNVYTYLYGASSYEARALMAPYLIQWSAILRGKERGAAWYDFYGLSPSLKPLTKRQLFPAEEYAYNSDAKEAGYTRFKLGFGGTVVAMPGTWDVVLKPLNYRFYLFLRFLRRLAA